MLVTCTSFHQTVYANIKQITVQHFGAVDYVKCLCNNFIKHHFNQYFVNNNNNNNNGLIQYWRRYSLTQYPCMLGWINMDVEILCRYVDLVE